MFRTPAAIHATSRPGFFRNSFWNWTSAESRTRPPFSWRPKSPPGTLCRSRANARTSGPSSRWRPGWKFEPEKGSCIRNGTLTCNPPTVSTIRAMPQNEVTAQ